MFANLKKKIEEEVGDLGRLTSPLTSFGNSDRRVSGSSTQGTNTPGLGSRQSSVASLIDTVDHRSNHHAGPVLTPRSAHNTSFSETSNDHIHANEIKKLNQEWHRKVEQLKKTYEEKLQTQELDFAWKYNSKDEEIEKLRAEKKRCDDQIKSMEGGYQQKLTRVQEDIDQLEGFSKQENAKIKHLLLNTQEELSQLKSQIFSKDQEIKQTNEEMRSLRIENENLHKNLDKITAKQSTTSLQDEEPHLPSCTHDEKEIEMLKLNLLSAEKKLNELDRKSRESQANFENEVLVMKVNFESQLAQVQSKFDNLIVQKSRLELEIAELNKSKAVSMEKDTEILKLSSKISSLETELQTLKQQENCQVASLSDDNKRLLENFTTLESLVNQSRLELDERKEEIEKVNITNGKLETENQELVVQASEVQAKVDELEEEITFLKDKIDQQMTKDITNDALDTRDIEIQGLNETLKEFKEAQVQENNKLHNTQEELSQLKSQIASKDQEIKQATEELHSLRIANENLRKQENAKHLHIQEELSLLKSQIASKDQEIKQSNEEVHSLRVTNENLQKQENHKLLNTQEELSVLKSQIASKDQEIKQLNEEMRSIRVANENLHKQENHKLLNTQEELSQLKSQICSQDQEIKQANEEMRSLRIENENQRKNLESRLPSCTHDEKEIEMLKLNLMSADKKLGELNQKSREIEANFENDVLVMKVNFESQLSEIQSKLDSVNVQRSKLELEVADLSKSKIISMEKDAEIVRLSSQISVLKDEQQSLTQENGQIASLTDVNERLQQNVTKLEGLVKQGRLALDERKEEIEQINITNGKLETENHELIVQASEVQAKVDELEEEITFLKDQIDQQTTKDLAKETVESREIQVLTERVRELEAQVQDNNKALKNRQQQLQDLRKSLAKELKSSANNDTMSVASNSSSIHSACMEDVSLTDESNLAHNQQHLHSHQLQPNHNHHENNISQPASLPPYETDVNFQYLRSVVFKYLTSHDPQVTNHLTRVVGTLLHLSEEEQQLLSHSTDSRLSWTASLLHKS